MGRRCHVESGRGPCLPSVCGARPLSLFGMGNRRRSWVVLVGHCWRWWVGVQGRCWWAVIGVDGEWWCRRVVVACRHCRAVVVRSSWPVIVVRRRRRVVSSPGFVVVVSSCHLLIGQVRWVGTGTLTNGRRRTTNLSSSKVACETRLLPMLLSGEGKKERTIMFSFP